MLKAIADKQFLSQETRDFRLKRQKSAVCRRQWREIFVARDENEKSNMFDIFNNGQEIFISCDKYRSCAVFGDLFLKLGIRVTDKSLATKIARVRMYAILARDKISRLLR